MENDESVKELLESTSADLLARWQMGFIPDGDGAALIREACDCVSEHMPVEDKRILDAYSMLVGGTITAVGIHLEQLDIDNAPEG